MQLNFVLAWRSGQAYGTKLRSQPPIEQAIAQRDQSLATLFGSQDYCETDDCTSVLSPAAYLCDLLLWLRNHPQGAQTALDVLDGRRPDIRHLLLNCPNTDTELPYVDLVNELLADKISPPTDPNSTINPIWKQTSAGLTAAQLSAAPEIFQPAGFRQAVQRQLSADPALQHRPRRAAHVPAAVEPAALAIAAGAAAARWCAPSLSRPRWRPNVWA